MWLDHGDGSLVILWHFRWVDSCMLPRRAGFSVALWHNGALCWALWFSPDLASLFTFPLVTQLGFEGTGAVWAWGGVGSGLESLASFFSSCMKSGNRECASDLSQSLRCDESEQQNLHPQHMTPGLSARYFNHERFSDLAGHYLFCGQVFLLLHRKPLCSSLVVTLSWNCCHRPYSWMNDGCRSALGRKSALCHSIYIPGMYVPHCTCGDSSPCNGPLGINWVSLPLGPDYGKGMKGSIMGCH